MVSFWISSGDLTPLVFEPLVGGFDHVGDHHPDQLADHAMPLEVLEFGAMPIEGLLEDLPEVNAIQHLRV